MLGFCLDMAEKCRKLLFQTPKSVVAVDVLSQNVSSLVELIWTGYNNVATKLSEAHVVDNRGGQLLLSEGTVQANNDATRQLLYNNVIPAVKENGEKFDNFLEVLKDINGPLTDLADKIKKEWDSKLKLLLETTCIMKFIQLGKMTSELKLSKLESHDSNWKPKQRAPFNNDSFKQFTCFRNEFINFMISSNNNDLMSRLYHKHVIGSAEKDIAQKTPNPIIKAKMILTAVGTMIQRSIYHDKMLHKVVSIFKQVGMKIPLELEQVFILNT